jgi:hypothetical protein
MDRMLLFLIKASLSRLPVDAGFVQPCRNP